MAAVADIPMPGSQRFHALVVVGTVLCGVLSLSVGVAAQSERAPTDATLEDVPLSRRPPPGADNVGVDEHLDRRIPTDLMFRDHTGRRVRLADVLPSDRPTVIQLVYHTCPVFCSLGLDGTVAALNGQPWTVGEDFDVVTISIDPRDTPEVAADKRRRLLFNYPRPSARTGWHFLVAPETRTEQELIEDFGMYPSIRPLADALGFRYQWNARQRQYYHPGLIMILTPGHRVARYLHGIEFDHQDVRLGLLEASEGRSVSVVEQTILYCYRYDPTEQGYTVVAWRVMQVGGGLTLAVLGGFLGIMWARELRRRRTMATAEARS